MTTDMSMNIYEGLTVFSARRHVGLPHRAEVPGIWLSGAMRPPRGTKQLWSMMGEEKVHCDLSLGQYGIVALTGGMMNSKNFDVLRLGVGKHINESKNSFAIYRVDPPYKPRAEQR